jgi:predicted nucleic acid-binding protein
MAVLVDTNVVVDYLNQEGDWFDWSAAMLGEAFGRGPVAINPVIYAEVAASYDVIEDVEAGLPRDYFTYLSLPWEAAFLAGQCFARYRRRGGVKTSPLPDFFIGAHAAVAGMTLLTRDARRYRTYFPKLKIIAP